MEEVYLKDNRLHDATSLPITPPTMRGVTILECSIFANSKNSQKAGGEISPPPPHRVEKVAIPRWKSRDTLELIKSGVTNLPQPSGTMELA